MDVTEEFLVEKPKEEQEEQETEETKEISTEEALKPFGQVINNLTALFLNKVLEASAEKRDLKLLEKEKIKPQEVEQTGFGEAVIKTISYYAPSLPVDHPAIALGAAAIGLGGIFAIKFSSIESRAKKEAKKEEETPEPEPEIKEIIEEPIERELTPGELSPQALSYISKKMKEKAK